LQVRSSTFSTTAIWNWRGSSTDSEQHGQETSVPQLP
jgi:hypothetical protein